MLATLAWAGAWVIAWAVFWRRKQKRWPLFVGLVPLGLMLAFLIVGFGWVVLLAFSPALPLGFIVTVGIGKLIVEMIGKRLVFKRSDMRSGRPAAPPRGMVE